MIERGEDFSLMLEARQPLGIRGDRCRRIANDDVRGGRAVGASTWFGSQTS
jgi:hypothetical protein